MKSTDLSWGWYVLRAHTFRSLSMILVDEMYPGDHLNGLRISHGDCIALVGFTNVDVPGAWEQSLRRQHELLNADPLTILPEVKFKCCGKTGLIRDGLWVDV